MKNKLFTSKWNLIVIAAIFVGVSLYFIFRGSAATPYTISMANDAITVKGTDVYSYVLPMSDVASAEIVTIDDFGELISGASNRTHMCGVYRNSQFGEYDIWIVKKVQSYLAVTDKDGHVLVINFESDKSTEELCKAINEYIGEN